MALQATSDHSVPRYGHGCGVLMVLKASSFLCLQIYTPLILPAPEEWRFPQEPGGASRPVTLGWEFKLCKD